jgi:hypothetical protein
MKSKTPTGLPLLPPKSLCGTMQASQRGVARHERFPIHLDAQAHGCESASGSADRSGGEVCAPEFDAASGAPDLGAVISSNCFCPWRAFAYGDAFSSVYNSLLTSILINSPRIERGFAIRRCQRHRDGDQMKSGLKPRLLTWEGVRGCSGEMGFWISTFHFGRSEVS